MTVPDSNTMSDKKRGTGVSTNVIPALNELSSLMCQAFDAYDPFRLDTRYRTAPLPHSHSSSSSSSSSTSDVVVKKDEDKGEDGSSSSSTSEGTAAAVQHQYVQHSSRER